MTIDDVPTLSWELFEALVAELYAREAEEVLLTSRGGDRGCDVIVLSEQCGHKLVQCKKTEKKRLQGESPMREVYAAKPFYEEKLGKHFRHLEVFTNAEQYSSEGIEAARRFGVQLRAHRDLRDLLQRHEVSLEQVLRRDANRVSF